MIAFYTGVTEPDPSTIYHADVAPRPEARISLLLVVSQTNIPSHFILVLMVEAALAIFAAVAAVLIASRDTQRLIFIARPDATLAGSALARLTVDPTIDVTRV